MANNNNLGQYYIGVGVDSSDVSKGLNQALASMTATNTKMVTVMQGMTNNMDRSFKQASSAAASASSTIQNSWGTAMQKIQAAVGVAGIAVAGFLATVAKGALDHEKALLQMSRATGMSIEDTSKWAFVAQQSGVSVETFSGAMQSLARRILTTQQAINSSKNVFNQYGVAIKDANGKMLPTSQILENIADRYNSLAPGMQRTAFAFAMFRGNAQAMMPLLQRGSAGIKELTLAAEQYGVVITDTKSFQTYIASQRQLEVAITGVKNQIGQALLPALTSLNGLISNVVKAFISIDPATRQTIIQFAALAGSIAALLGGLAALKLALSTLGFTQLALAVGALMNPVATLRAGFAVLSAVLLNVWAAISLLPGAMANGVSGMRAWASVTGITSAAIGILRMAVIGLVAIVGVLAVAWFANFNNIREATADAVNAIAQAFSSLWEHIKGIAGGIGKVIAGAMLGDVDMIKDGIASVKTNWTGALADVRSAASSTWSGMKTAFSTITGADSRFGQSAPGGGGDSDFQPSAASAKGETAYDIAKRQYEEEIALTEHSEAEKLALYKKYLADVQKEEKEKTDYIKGLGELERAAKKEALEIQKIDLETKLNEGKISTAQAYQERIKIYEEELAKTKSGTEQQAQAYKKLADEKVAYARWAAEEEQKALERQIAHKNSLLDLERSYYEYLSAFGIITKTQEIQEIMKLDEQAYRNKRTALEKQLNDEYLTAESIREIQGKLQALDDQYTTKKIQNAISLLKEQKKYLLELKSNMAGTFDEMFQGLIKGTMSIKEAFGNIASTILGYFTKQWADKLADKIFAPMFAGDAAGIGKQVTVAKEEVAAVAAVKTAGRTADIAAEEAHSAAVIAAGAATATATVGATAAAFEATLAMLAASAAAIAAIPPAGPAMAAAMTAGITAAQGTITAATVTAKAAIAATGAVGLAVGAWDIPHDMLAQVHQGEVVVPKTFAEGVRSYAAGNERTGMPSSLQIDYHVHSPDAKTFRDLLRKHGKDLADIAASEIRKFNRGSVKVY